ncbi:hypothetical protein NJF44_06520 [Pseudomonas guariconensis]|uniref:hypothetical protein n=1 Tax=Pseudomonas TaxID=286 RepID=UPI001CE3BEFE|nr:MULTISPECIES: hypothetical protein [Pseudomonas]MCO7637445.1 hypothetical protein [Pseudomonas sp. S 311-6]MCO7514040.1 hypothetical protein [Pseudomonas putida]MCO7564051.1 hypothetical protein [Pseudomonas mosselii]MCO7593921.1 hypothetical protein [Pseudomonas guariconensis]MCO7604896.1 hypothetical protein [Pseudomonas guariconensis]
MRMAPLICLLGSLTLLGGCFDRDNDHPAKDADPSKPSLQMQQPDAPATQPTPEPQPMPPRDQDN